MKVAAVVVTYKAPELLQLCIKGIRNQSYEVNQIVVVNNGGADDTADWLLNQKDILSINQNNSGGAGGFKTGINKVFKRNFEWIWCLDQDIIPHVDTLSNLINSDARNGDSTGFLTSIILSEDDEPVPINIPQFDNNHNVIKKLYSWNVVPVVCCSFSSILINIKAVKKVGLPYEDFFIWGDDSEYTLRICDNGFKGYAVIKSIATHKDCLESNNPFTELDIQSIKFKYGLRNYYYINRLKSKVLHQSIANALVSTFYFYYKVIYGRIRKHGVKNILELPFIIHIIIKGIFFKPKK